ncbi:hypothetical protein LOK49_LG05G00013 [Camellia lanceoleosa]|uniref:Uncharacterized protein n=1 Tax=Camellia lanceoleosa TaxID=1840588 RepID=A0ACC0HUB6_9ERIC|nr:hypothetical protein LOK49_LG05G00013 [Camellia lanceoleosa]
MIDLSVEFEAAATHSCSKFLPQFPISAPLSVAGFERKTYTCMAGLSLSLAEKQVLSILSQPGCKIIGGALVLSFAVLHGLFDITRSVASHPAESMSD